MECNDLNCLDPFATGKEIVQQRYPNPFFLPAEGSFLKHAERKILASGHKHVYILCLRDDFEPTKENVRKIRTFFEKNTKPELFMLQQAFVTLVAAPFSVVNFPKIRSGLILVNSKYVNCFNHHGYSLMENELIFLMLETRERDVRKWIKLYSPEKNIDEFIRQKIFMSYYGLNDKCMEMRLVKMVSDMVDFNYWEDEKNCFLDINDEFKERKFNIKNFQNFRVTKGNREDELKKILQIFVTGKNVQNNSYVNIELYPGEHKARGANDSPKISEIVKSSRYHSFFEVTKEEDLVIDPLMVEELLTGRTLNEKEKYYLICNFLVSKNYCHYVIRNEKILKENSQIFNKYAPIFRYLIGYTWITLYKEESIKRSRTKENNRYVFDLETASMLPVFPFLQTQPYLNPYFTLLVSETLVNANYNLHGVRQIFECQKGIVTLQEFKRRLNIFMTGKENKNLLEGANWKNMVITGGCMAAMMPKMNPLMLLFKREMDQNVFSEEELDRFFMEYYSASDIDVACNHENILDFIEHVKHLRSVLATNLGVAESEVKIQPTKTLAIYVNGKLLKEMCESGKLQCDYEYIISNRDKESVKMLFYEYYVEYKGRTNINNKKILGNKLLISEYFEIISYCDFRNVTLIIDDTLSEIEASGNREPNLNSGIEMVFFMYDDSNGKVGRRIFIKFMESLKYSITSRHMKHPFEVFRITESEYFSAVAKFHLPCVRSYYNGKTCYLVPSAIIAYHTLTNIDFKYFVGKHDPIFIINKYRKRGYGMILNKEEIKHFISYILEVENSKLSYGISDSKDVENIIGPLNISHKFFKPKENIPEEFDPNLDLNYFTPNVKYPLNCNDFVGYFGSKYSKLPNEFLTKRVINSNGQVEPLERWMIDACYSLLSK
ncbi:MAG: hypothetical protein QW303_05245 [Nitrososphaerota archaeon]